MKRRICLLLVVCLCLTLLSACGEKKKLLGTWECNINLTEQVSQLLKENQLGGELPFGDFNVTLQLTFTEDDRFSLTVDQQALTESLQTLSETLEKGLLDTLQQQLSEAGLTVDIDSLLALSSFSPDDLTEKLRQAFSEAQFPEKLSQPIALEGFYKVKGKKLLLTDDPEVKLDKIYFPYTLEGNTLTLSTQVGVSAFLQDHPILQSAPVTFTKAS